MTTVTGQVQFNFAAAADEDPWVDANFANEVGSFELVSGVLRANGAIDALACEVASTWTSAGDLTAKVEAWGIGNFDAVGVALINPATGNGYALALDTVTGAPRLRLCVVDAGVLDTVDLVASYPTFTFAQGDTFYLSRNMTTGAMTVYRNGSIYQTSGSANSVTDNTYAAGLVPSLYCSNGNAHAEAIRSFAADGLAADGALTGAAAGEAAATGTLYTPNLGLNLTNIYQPNANAVAPNATGVAWAVFDKPPDGTETRRVGGTSGAITGGAMVIDHDSVGALGGSCFVVLRWTMTVGETTYELTYSATEAVVDLNA